MVVIRAIEGESELEYYICHKGKRLMGPMTKEEATRELFTLKGTFTGLSILIVDEETGMVKGEIKSKKRKP
jgi:hypothetical protein